MTHLSQRLPALAAGVAAVVLIAGHTVAVAAPPVVRVTDLGTLGGNSSFAAAISPFDQVVGTSDTAGGTRNAFSWTRARGMVDLGALAQFGSRAVDVSPGGVVVG